MPLTITTLYVLPLAIIWFALWLSVSRRRMSYGQSIGDGGHQSLLLQIRRHGNFIESVPIVLCLMILGELQQVSPLALHAAGASLLLGRLLHPFGLQVDNGNHPLRYIGNSGTILAVAIMVVALIAALASR